MPAALENPERPAPETVGKRIARLRSEHSWTQQALALRLAISRVAVSHIEMDLTIPSERTVILLAGLFKLSPQALVEGTTYPLAKAERLPETTCSYTQLELNLALFENDLEWLEKLPNSLEKSRLTAQTLESWTPRLAKLAETGSGEHERELLDSARLKLRKWLDDLH